MGGNVLIFKSLSDEMSSRPFYGLQARGLNGEENSHTSIEAMALDYLNYVRQVQPHGPYFLGGYSAGGLVAFEMARILQESGETVRRLILLDTYFHPHTVGAAMPAQRVSLSSKVLSGIQRRFWLLKNLQGERRLAFVRHDLERAWSGIKIKAYPRLLGKLSASTAFLLALRTYRPKPSQVSATLFVADQNAPQSSASLPAMWRDVIKGALEIVHLEVSHHELLDEKHAKALASYIENQIGS
jgi:acetoacetyl-CoA synthetase